MDEIKRNNLLKAIDTANKDITVFKRSLLDKKKELPNIDDIKRKLTKIDSVTKDMKDLCVAEDKSLETQLEKIRIMQLSEIMSDFETILEVIKANFPKTMDLVIVDDEQSGENYKKFEIQDSAKPIGYVQIRNDKNIHVDIEITGIDRETCIIDNPYKVYSIINFILTKYNFN